MVNQILVLIFFGYMVISAIWAFNQDKTLDHISETRCIGSKVIPKKIQKVSVCIFPLFRRPAKIGGERNMWKLQAETV